MEGLLGFSPLLLPSLFKIASRGGDEEVGGGGEAQGSLLGSAGKAGAALTGRPVATFVRGWTWVQHGSDLGRTREELGRQAALRTHASPAINSSHSLPTTRLSNVTHSPSDFNTSHPNRGLCKAGRRPPGPGVGKEQAVNRHQQQWQTDFPRWTSLMLVR